MAAVEVNFDSIIGPTHAYAGLGLGNRASQRHRRRPSHPRHAALEGLAKTKQLANLGLRQAVLPPQPRPDLAMLRRLGFDGADEQVLHHAWREDPAILAACSSASAMWAANAATVSPSADTADQRLHLTPANLVSQFHRSIEAATTSKLLRAIFPADRCFAHHPSLPACFPLADEGAANHTRLCTDYGAPGLELFVYGRDAQENGPRPRRYPARQSLAASQAIARLHQLRAAGVLFLRQNPQAIDAGVFHNDVICVGNQNVLLVHELAFEAGLDSIEVIRRSFADHCGGSLCVVTILADELTLDQAVSSYLFNSQLITLPDTGRMRLIAPTEARDQTPASTCVQRIIADSTNPIDSVSWVDVRQSMNNGGGPACLRLRVVLNEAELSAVHPGVFLTDSLYEQLVQWVGRHYRERLELEDLADPNLVRESLSALEELENLLGLKR